MWTCQQTQVRTRENEWVKKGGEDGHTEEVMAALLTPFISLAIARPLPNAESTDTFQKTQLSREDWLLVDKEQRGLSPQLTATPHPGSQFIKLNSLPLRTR